MGQEANLSGQAVGESLTERLKRARRRFDEAAQLHADIDAELEAIDEAVATIERLTYRLDVESATLRDCNEERKAAVALAPRFPISALIEKLPVYDPAWPDEQRQAWARWVHILIDAVQKLASSPPESEEKIDWPTPLAALQFRMEQGGHTQADLARLIGSRSRAAEILSGKRSISKAQICLLVDEWGIPARSLLGPSEGVHSTDAPAEESSADPAGLSEIFDWLKEQARAAEAEGQTLKQGSQARAFCTGRANAFREASHHVGHRLPTQIVGSASAEARAVYPAGWVLVPREPSAEMTEVAVKDTRAEISFADASDIWDAMLAARPTPPKAEGGR